MATTLALVIVMKIVGVSRHALSWRRADIFGTKTISDPYGRWPVVIAKLANGLQIAA